MLKVLTLLPILASCTTLVKGHFPDHMELTPEAEAVLLVQDAHVKDCRELSFPSRISKKKSISYVQGLGKGPDLQEALKWTIADAKNRASRKGANAMVFKRVIYDSGLGRVYLQSFFNVFHCQKNPFLKQQDMESLAQMAAEERAGHEARMVDMHSQAAFAASHAAMAASQAAMAASQAAMAASQAAAAASMHHHFP